MRVDEIVGRDAGTGRMMRVVAREGVISRLEEIAEENDLFLSAGFVDLQVNGFSGFDMNAEDVSIETVQGLVDALLARGITCFAPTLITASEERIRHGLMVIAEARRTSARVAACISHAHVEGPHISPLDGYRGAHPAAWVRPPSIAEFDRWQEASRGMVGMVTLSPHYPGSVEYIEHVTKRGVHVALGHTHAGPEEIRLAVEAGARLSTHLGNGIAGEIPRHRNAIWSQMAENRLTATVIADGQHLPADVLQVILRAKGLERVVLVSDAVALAGMTPGVYETPVGGKVELRADGRLCVLGTELLAGSMATLADCIANVVLLTGTSLADALAMATAQPGRFAGGRGRLEVGRFADVVRIRWDGCIDVEDVWLRGERVQVSHA